MQTRDTIRMLKIPARGTSPLCPFQAIKHAMILSPGTENSPLFLKNECAQWVPLTNTKVRQNCTQILTRLGLQHSGISLHTFRHSSVTLAFNLNVSIQNIQSHGTWTSDCIWRYIIQNHNASQQAADSFKICFITLSFSYFLVGHWRRLASTSNILFLIILMM